MVDKKYLSSETSPVNKHLWRTHSWMPVQQYREYQKNRVEAARAERDEARQKEDLHNAFLENAQKQGIPVRRKRE